MKVSQLRDLTRRYAAGRLAREDYLAERTRLIDGIVAGEIDIHYRELEPAQSARARSSQAQWLVTGGIMMLVGLLLIALLAYFIDEGGATTRPTGDTPGSAAHTPGIGALEQFMRARDWSDASLQELEADWNALSAFQRENARRSAAYRRLKHETAQRIVEQEALLAAGKMEALLKVTRLRAFAERLGIPVEP